jgi:antitoxin (DNA-binding transcriptional repressor) of toxin-antitoxin stability system
MTREISERELRNSSGEVMRALDIGETFVLTHNGVPVGELTPLRRRSFVPKATVLAAFANAPAVDPGQFRADVDTFADQNPAPGG